MIIIALKMMEVVGIGGGSRVDDDIRFSWALTIYLSQIT